MATTYGSEIGIDESAMITALLITQFIGVPFAFLFGALAARIGAKTRGVRRARRVRRHHGARLLHDDRDAFLRARRCWSGMVQGGTQALSRSLFASMIPRHKSSEFFAFFGVFERYAGILGPAVFAWVVAAQRHGPQRDPVGGLFFVIGAALLTFVDVDGGRRAARAAEAELRPA